MVEAIAGCGWGPPSLAGEGAALVTVLDRQGRRVEIIDGGCTDFGRLSAMHPYTAFAYIDVLPGSPCPGASERVYVFDHAAGRTFQALVSSLSPVRLERPALVGGGGRGAVVAVRVILDSDGKPEAFTSVEGHGWAYEPKGGPK